MAVLDLKSNNRTQPTQPPHNRINYLGVCIAVKAHTSVFLLGEAGVAAQAVWSRAAQKVGLSPLKSCDTSCAELRRMNHVFQDETRLKGGFKQCL